MFQSKWQRLKKTFDKVEVDVEVGVEVGVGVGQVAFVVSRNNLFVCVLCCGCVVVLAWKRCVVTLIDL